MKILASFAALTIVTTAAASAQDRNALQDYSVCTARAAVQFDDGRPDYSPVARAVVATCRSSYHSYVSYMRSHHPAERVPSERDLAISAVQYERKYGPALFARQQPHH